ncbi:MAG: PHB depolymerase family esterase [Pseudomonadota bacterium]
MGVLMKELAKATELTRGGRLAEATRLIQKALGLKSERASSHNEKPTAHSDGKGPTLRPTGRADLDRSAPANEAAEDIGFREIEKPPPAPSVDKDAVKPAADGEHAQAAREKLDDITPDVQERPVPEVPAPVSRDVPAPAKPRPASFTAHEFAFGPERYVYRLYLPSLEDEAAAAELPLVVLLHGCKQDAADFALGTAMNELAESEKCIVLYPEQLAKANSMRCWNWFETAHQGRDAGEPAMLVTLVRQVQKKYHADPSRTYVAGLSAGGAMAAMVAALYPEAFAAVGVHSGLPPGAAHDVISAFSAMRKGARKSHGSTSKHEAQMPTIVFHGDADATVHPDNGDQIVAAAVATLKAAGVPLKKVKRTQVAVASTPPDRSSVQTIYTDPEGKSFVEYWAVASGPHAWSGGDSAGSFTDPQGPSASRAMLRFFLQHRK